MKLRKFLNPQDSEEMFSSRSVNLERGVPGDPQYYNVTNTFYRRWFYKNRTWFRQSKPYKVTLPYDVETVTVGSAVWLLREDQPGYPSNFYSGEPSWYNPETGMGFESVDSLSGLHDAMNRCLDHSNGAQWNAPVFVKEFHQTQKMVGDFARAVSNGVQALRDAKRGGWGKAERRVVSGFKSIASGRRKIPPLSRNASGAWLQLRYGVEVGIMDLKNAAETLADLLLDHQESKTFNGKTVLKSSTSTSHSYWGHPFVPYFWAGDIQFRQTIDVTVTSKAWIRAHYDRSPVVAQLNQLGLVNLPLNLWELTWLSFVADWVLDLGNYLSRLSALLGLVIEDAGYGVTKSCVLTVTPVNNSTAWLNHVWLEKEPVTITRVVYTRRIWENPSAIWTPRVNMSTKRVIDAAALIRSIPLGRIKTF